MALMYAIQEDRPEIVELLLNAGVDPAARGNQDIVMMLIERGAYAKKIVDGKNLLHVAAGSGNTGSARALVAAGVDVVAGDSAGRTPLQLARNDAAIVSLYSGSLDLYASW
ncbi:ankyrin repeat domain-containing protein [Aspergillus lucknowensis]|uniref:Ankyrin repeat-containing domain protein n=1 Tax=Aspergillus lucknowensis TaxID=176173 RepID=A0ABR4LQY8_9EURO